MTTVKHINPDGLVKSPTFSQGIVVPAGAKTLYIGGQNAVDGDGALVGGNDIALQTEQALKNLRTVLRAAGADMDDLVKCTVHLVAGQQLQDAFGAWAKVAGKGPPPTVTMMFVSALGHPDWLVEIEGIAIVP